MMDGAITVSLAALVLTLVGGIWTWNLWLNRQFSSVRMLIYEQFDKMLARLESHEKHDNNRFSDVNNHLWELRLDAATHRRERGFDQETETRKP